MNANWDDLDEWDEEDDLEELARWCNMKFPPVNLYSIPKLQPITKKEKEKYDE